MIHILNTENAISYLQMLPRTFKEVTWETNLAEFLSPLFINIIFMRTLPISSIEQMGWVSGGRHLDININININIMSTLPISSIEQVGWVSGGRHLDHLSANYLVITPPDQAVRSSSLILTYHPLPSLYLLSIYHHLPTCNICHKWKSWVWSPNFGVLIAMFPALCLNTFHRCAAFVSWLKNWPRGGGGWIRGI